MTNEDEKPPFEVISYDRTQLLEIFTESCGLTKDKISSTYLYKYFTTYFNYKYPPGIESKKHARDGFRAQTIVIEKDYISDSYLRDCSNYYTECFRTYKKFTKRVHFFEAKFNSKEFELLVCDSLSNDALQSQDKKRKLWKSYIGYIVIKPISNAFIGATMLKTYNSNFRESRHFFAVVNQKIHLFGKELFVKGLAFQQQDNAVSVCATNALWAAFHKTSHLFGTSHPAPSEITISSGPNKNGNRLLPSNDALSNRQIANAIENVGLVSEMIVYSRRHEVKEKTTFTNEYIKRYIYAYAKMGIPVLLGYYQFQKNEHLGNVNFLEFENDNLHLVTIIGFRNDEEIDESIYKNDELEFLSSADRIKRIYVNNDSLGPYARIGFSNEKDSKQRNSIDIFYPHSKAKKGIAVSMITPLDPLIRVKYQDITRVIRVVNVIANTAFEKYKKSMSISQGIIEWEIYLEKGVNYKKDIMQNPTINSKKLKAHILFSPYPKYIWIARAKNSVEDGNILFDIIYDATDMPTGFCSYKMNYFEEKYSSMFKDEIKSFFDKTIEPFVKDAKDIGGDIEIESIQSLPIHQAHLKFFLEEEDSSLNLIR